MRAVVRLAGASSEFIRLVSFAEKFAGRCGLADSERARLLIILEELFTNAVHHGGRPDGVPAEQIEVALATSPGRIEIDFIDNAPPFDPLAQAEPEFGPSLAERSVGGLGLHIVRSLVDEARYRRKAGRNCLTLVRNLSRTG